MKRCPACNRVYTDQSLNYCLHDGTNLVAPGGDDPGRQARPTGRSPSDVPTEVLPRGGQGSGFANQPTLPVSPLRAPGPFPANPPRANNTKLLVAVLIVVLLTGGVGLGLMLSRAGGGEEVRGGAEDSAKAGQTPAASSTPTPYATPQPAASQTATPASATPTPTATPEPTPNLSRARSEVMSLMNTWAESMRRQDVGANLSLYADRLDAYYQRGSVGREQVRSDRQAIFSKFYSSTDVQLDNLSVELDPSGTAARVTYDNSYDWRGGSKYLIGKSHNAMTLSKQGSRWLITSEEHLGNYGPDRSGN
jgi:ketosteroid isomerase-like protein